MRPRQLPWKRLLLLGVGLAVAAICLVPWWIGDTSKFGQLVALRLQHWTGGQVRLTGPVRVRYFPDISIRSGIEMRNTHLWPGSTSISCNTAKISLNLMGLFLGQVNLEAVKLVHPEITVVKTSPKSSAGLANTESALLRALRKRPLDLLDVKDGTMTVQTAHGLQTVQHLTVHIDAGRHADDASGSGSFEWHGEQVQFSLDTGLTTAEFDAATRQANVPLTIDVDSAPVTLKFTGNASLAPELRLAGTLDSQIPDLRRLLSWSGVAKLQGPGLKTISASGSFHSDGETLTFDEGRFSIDGNDATGLLSVSFANKRPHVEATLAFDALDLDPYFPHLSGAAAKTAAKLGPTPAPAEQSGKPLFDWPLVQYLDSDLRLSATSITIAGKQLGDGAFTLAANDGVVMGDIGELQICGGSASGQFTLDLSAPERQAEASGTLDGINLEPCLQMLNWSLPFKGVSSLKGSLSTQGRSLTAFLQGLSGDVEIKASNGSVALDLSGSAEDQTPLQSVGWSEDGGTSFTALSTDCHVGGGDVWCPSFSMATDAGTVTGSGDIDLDDRNIDWTLALPPVAEIRSRMQIQGRPPEQITVRGPLARPLIRRLEPQRVGDGNGLKVPPGKPTVTPN
jgi:AsmA protein